MSKTSSYLAKGSNSSAIVHGVRSTNDCSVTCHDHAVPQELEQDIESLYENIFSSFSHFKAYGGLTTDTCTYVCRTGDRISAIFLFRRVRDTVAVLNEGMCLNTKAVEDFANYVFSRWPQVALITFNAVRPKIGKFDYPLQRHECTAQVAMPLPSSEQVYLDSLGKNMRRNIRRYLKALTHDFSTFHFQVYGPGEVCREDLRTIFELSRSRIDSLNKSFALDHEAEHIFDLAQMRGCVGIATIDGKVIGGIIGFRTGGTYFAKVLGHHPDYTDYSLGILCCYLMIRECIAQGLKEFNFMWNEYPYKTALGGKRVSLERLVIYRSPLQLVCHAHFAIKTALHGWRYQLSSLLEKADTKTRLSGWERALLGVVQLVRRCHHALRRRLRTDLHH